MYFAGKDYELIVVDMKPDSKGSLVDTDVEIDLELSEEFLRQQQQESASGRTVGRVSPVDASTVPNTNGQASAAGNSLRASSPAISGVFRSLNETTSAAPVASIASTSSVSVGVALAQYLLPEPAPQDKDSVAVKIKLPTGVTKTRRFAFASEVRQLFLYIAIEIAQSGVSLPPAAAQDANGLLNSVQVSTRFPPRALRFGDVLNDSGAEAHKSFADMGMNVPSEAVFAALL